MNTDGRRRLVRAVSTVLICAGGVVLVDAVCTLTWQEPLTAYIASRSQGHLRDDLGRLGSAAPTTAQQRQLAKLDNDRQRIAYMARELGRGTRPGQALGRIVVPRIGADFVVVKGSQPADLRKGPGLYDNSPLPGVGGTVAIAGHRTTYLAPFRHVDDLRTGDPIHVEMPYASFEYKVTRTQIVSPSDVGVVGEAGFDQLVLTACHPLFSASKRIVVFARLVSERPARVVGYAARGLT